MKKLMSLLLVVAGAGFLYAADVYEFIPASSTVNSSNLIARPGRLYRNCLTEVTFTSVMASTGSFTVLEEGTTIYHVQTATGIPFNKSWSMDNPLCTTVTNSSMTITIAPSPARLNYQGYIKGK